MNFLENTHPSWHSSLEKAFASLDKEYLAFLQKDISYFPDKNNFLNAFRELPKEQTKYILFGQDPYPREKSAIGVAFIDGAVKSIFSENGLSKEVNKATSLRNFIKMALVANNLLQEDTSQKAIAKLDKKNLINSIYELKENFEKNGVLLLNTALIFTEKKDSKQHSKMWQPFIHTLLNEISPDTQLILFGNFAKEIKKKLSPKQNAIELEHPYNHSFISNKEAHKLFSPMKLLEKG